MHVRSVLVAAAALISSAAAVAVPIHSQTPAGYLITRESDGLQDIVTWDEKSIFVRGERVVIYSGEFHPFRLPVPDLWLDIFQKIKALGYNGVSFYINWALLEGQQGTYRASGIFALEPFFEAASEAGIYLLARPGPYINAEVSGGGFPGWLDRVDAPYQFRTNNTNYINATTLYAQSVGETIAKGQITNGGPIILAQPENEYSAYTSNAIFPNDVYFGEVIDQLRNAGIVIPLISNDASPKGLFAPGNPNYTVHVDIYGYDGYPQGFDCQQPYYWKPGNLPTDWTMLHRNQSPSTPNSIVEFQGGSFDPWGGYGFDNCAALTNAQFERVFYKNNWSFQVTFFNIYMTYGGSNWGNLGHPQGYSSYDYGAVIREDRAVTRTKYSEAKLLANFIKVTPGFATAEVMLYTNTSYVSTPDLTVTALIGNDSNFGLYIVRHSQYQSNDTTSYTLTLPASSGNVTIPQLSSISDHLILDGRDSKVHVVGYPVGQMLLEYSTAEVFTWERFDNGTVLVLYGDADEVHEFALSSGNCSLESGKSSLVAINSTAGQQIVQWSVTPEEKIVKCGSLTVYLLWRNEAYNWWTLELPADAPLSNFTSSNKTSVIVKGGNLMRTAQIINGDLYLTGDINETTTISIQGSPPYNDLYFNGMNMGASPATIEYTAPTLNLPDLNQSAWQSLDSLPELSSSYDDTKWPVADDSTTVSQFQPNTSEVLFAGQYGFHCGSLIYRGHFTAPSSGSELNLSLLTQGGQAYGYSLWLNSTNIYQFPGISTNDSNLHSMQLTNLTAGAPYVLTA
ncbi:Beta-galactosidase [Cyphellophora attinorum]|uniref:Beta-galactosidase n=1 Tax=Cyphellophora attinorum TaxID=1664694 RepID=A0A0N0NI10_9EURO|nr:Beta-galactosidase [Phialophora attinorum]KPI35301.1 Beta-galactosidase [Phialophora attinorum]